MRGATLLELALILTTMSYLFFLPLALYRQIDKDALLPTSVGNGSITHGVGHVSSVLQAFDGGNLSFYEFIPYGVSTDWLIHDGGGGTSLSIYLAGILRSRLFGGATLYSDSASLSHGTYQLYWWNGAYRYAHTLFDMATVVNGGSILGNVLPWGALLAFLHFNEEVVIMRHARVPRDQAHRLGLSAVRQARNEGYSAAYAVGLEGVYGLEISSAGFVGNGTLPFVERIPSLLGTTLPQSSDYTQNRVVPYIIPLFQRQNKFPYVLGIPSQTDDLRHLSTPINPVLTYVDVAIKIK